MALIGFIGNGNMGFAMLKGALKVFDKGDITYTTKTEEKRNLIKQETKVEFSENNIELVKKCKYVILAIKPQYFESVIDEIKDYVNNNHVIISIAAGITIDNLKKMFKKDIRIVRAMPNTPAMVNEGMTAICYDSNLFKQEEIDIIVKFFNSFGKCEKVSESLINAVICASGSSPAYVYMFIETLADSVVQYGIPRDMAYKFVAQMVLGSAKMVLETNEHPAKLKDNVCSPSGTTIKGVAELEKSGFRNAIIKATDACFKRAEDMSKINKL